MVRTCWATEVVVVAGPLYEGLERCIHAFFTPRQLYPIFILLGPVLNINFYGGYLFI